MKKKLWIFGIVALLILAMTSTSFALFGFGDDDKKEEGPVTITVSSGKDTTGGNKKMIEKFEKEYPNIKVNYVEQPMNTDTQHSTYVTKLSSGDASIDVFFVDVIWPAEFAAAGWLQPLDKYFTEEEKEKFLPGPIDAVSYNGNMYAVPFFSDAGMLYYRKDIVDNPPETWDELYNQAKKYKGQKGTDMGFTFQAKQYEGLVCDFLEYVWANNGEVLDDQGNVVIDSPNTVQALEYMKKLVQSEVTPDGITTYTEEPSRRPFNQGKVVFHRNWPYAYSIAQKDSSPIKGKVGITPMPKGPKGDSNAATLGGWNLAINKYSEHTEAAVKFVKYMTSYESQVYNAVETSRIPTRKKVYKNEKVLEANPYYEDLYPVFMSAKPRPVTPYYPELSEVMQIQVHKALNGVKSPEAAVKEMQKQMEKIMNK